MLNHTKILLTAAFATAVIAAPAASFAQTPDKALSTGGEQHNKEKTEMDQTREGAGTSRSGMSGEGSSSSGGSMSGSSTGGTAGYTDANPAPPPNAQQNAPRPNN